MSAFVIELHGDGVRDEFGALYGTLTHHDRFALAMRTADDVEQQLRLRATDRDWRRAYVLSDRSLKAVIGYNHSYGSFCYIARATDYPDTWQLPFSSGERSEPVTGILGVDVQAETFAEAEAWADTKLDGPTSTVAILNPSGELVAAWERSYDGRLLLVSRAILFY